jgi:hypothetical protein
LSGNATLSKTEAQGMSVGSWNTNPSRLLLSPTVVALSH